MLFEHEVSALRALVLSWSLAASGCAAVDGVPIESTPEVTPEEVRVDGGAPELAMAPPRDLTPVATDASAEVASEADTPVPTAPDALSDTPEATTASGIDATETGIDATEETTADVPPQPLGTFASPLLLGALPATVAGNTTTAPGGDAAAYTPCAPKINEGGPEVVYALSVPGDGVVTATVDDVTGDAVDVDVHLLTAPAANACIARGNVTAQASLPAGPAWVVVDTWVDAGGVPHDGSYVLTVSWKAKAPPGDPTNCAQSPIQCTEADLPLVNAVPVEPAGAPGCPAGMAHIEAFCIDRYEASLVLVGADGVAAPWSPYAHPTAAAGTLRAVSAPGQVPQGYISQTEAKAACVAAKKRLCTDAEWLRACQGPQKTTYPYGAVVMPKTCNDSRVCHPAVQFFETGQSWIWSKLGHPCLNQLPAGLAATGSYPACVSAEGVFDLMGNLHEWTADPNGTFRGGFYVDTKINGAGCLYVTTAHATSHWDYSTGFRCCADVAP